MSNEPDRNGHTGPVRGLGGNLGTIPIVDRIQSAGDDDHRRRLAEVVMQRAERIARLEEQGTVTFREQVVSREDYRAAVEGGAPYATAYLRKGIGA